MLNIFHWSTRSAVWLKRNENFTKGEVKDKDFKTRTKDHDYVSDYIVGISISCVSNVIVLDVEEWQGVIRHAG